MAGETSLNNTARARDGSYAPTGTAIVRKNFTFADQGDGEIVIGVLPPGAYVGPGSGIWVKTLFDGTTPTIDVGVAGTPAMFGSAVVLTAATFVPLDDEALAAAVPTSTYRNIVGRIQGTAATVGSVDAVVEIIHP